MAAVKQVEGGMGLRKASKLYNVLCESLRRVNGTVDLDCRTGPLTVLTEDEEDTLIHYSFQMADMGFRLTREGGCYVHHMHCCQLFWQGAPIYRWNGWTGLV